MMVEYVVLGTAIGLYIVCIGFNLGYYFWRNKK